MKMKKFIRSNPQLPVKNLRETLDYYRDELGFVDEWTWKNAHGEIKDGGIRRDEMRLLFAEDPEFTTAINNEKNNLPLMWFVEHVEEVSLEFQKRGVKIAEPLRAHPYGRKEFAFADINGYYVRVAEGSAE